MNIGDKAPDFLGKDENGKEIHLSDYKGKKVVIYFYPKASTPGCTTQACGLRDTAADFAALNTRVLGISPDAPAKLKKFEDKQQLNFTLLADETHQVADAFGVWGPKKFMGKSFDGIHRISFLIDEHGVIQHVFDDFKTSNHHDVVLAYLKSA